MTNTTVDDASNILPLTLNFVEIEQNRKSANLLCSLPFSGAERGNLCLTQFKLNPKRVFMRQVTGSIAILAVGKNSKAIKNIYQQVFILRHTNSSLSYL